MLFFCFSLYIVSYNDADIALNCGSILREVIRHEELNEMLLNAPQLFNAFFELVQLNTFDVASDAFATFKVEKGRNGREKGKEQRGTPNGYRKQREYNRGIVTEENDYMCQAMPSHIVV